MEVEIAISSLKFSGNLSERHRALNQSVITAHTNHIEFTSIVNVKENSPYGRLFKIDLASKYKNVEYILNSLKCDDMMYVSRALKSLWILEEKYSNIINPEYLEAKLYPEMHFKAVNKMKKFISKNLKEESRNECFHQYYKEKDFSNAFNFLKKCSSEYILKESKEIVEKLTPKRLTVLSKKNVLVTRMFYDKLEENTTVLDMYCWNSTKYYKQLIFILKLNPDLYLDIIETYFQQYQFQQLSFSTSKFIMQNKKQRFFSKPELYTSWFLNTKAVASSLTKNENKELIYKLAKAEYLQHWFSYKTIEPLMKQLDKESRSLTKKEVFVDTVKDKIKEWPYKIPIGLFSKGKLDDFYQDEELKFTEPIQTSFRKCIKKRKYCKFDYECRDVAMSYQCEGLSAPMKRKTLLDELFDQYRFVSFDNTLAELRKRITTESNPQNRMYMLLVLVSKSAGNNEHLDKLLTFLVQKHKNETNNFRAAIVRSLVKKAYIWRVESKLWDLILKYAHGLGLDGAKTDLVCAEGLHCVIIRKAIIKEDINPQIQSLYLENFDTMEKYALSLTEKAQVYEYIKNMLLESAKVEVKPLSQLQKLLQLLKTAKIKLSDCPEIKDTIVKTVKKDGKNYELLLRTLYDSKECRKELFKDNFAVIRKKNMYYYALKNDISVLDLDVLTPLPEEKFLKKLAIYFSEDLSPKYADILERIAEKTESQKNMTELARCLAIVSGNKMGKTIEKFASGDEKSKQFAKALKANYNLARADFSQLAWNDIGGNAVAALALNCKSSETKDIISRCTKWKSSAAVAVRLALRNDPTLIPEILKAVSIYGPLKVLPIGVECIRTNKKVDYNSAWEAIKDLIPKLSELKEQTQKRLIEEIVVDLDDIPDGMKASYYRTVYEYSKKEFKEQAKPILVSIVNNNINELSDIIIDAAEDFYKNQFTLKTLESNDFNVTVNIDTFITLFTRFVLLSVNAENVDFLFDRIIAPFFQVYKEAQGIVKNKLRPYQSYNETMIYDFLEALRFNKAFFNKSQTSILPLLEKITEYSKSFLSVEKNFKIYSYLHFTMLYYKSVQQCIKQKSDIFGDKKNEESVKILGTVFGKYIASETKQMIDSYFLSIRDLYKENFSYYLNDYFKSHETKMLFIKSIILSILETDIHESYLVAEYLYSDLFVHEDKEKEVLKKFESCQSMEVLFHLHENSNY